MSDRDKQNRFNSSNHIDNSVFERNNINTDANHQSSNPGDTSNFGSIDPGERREESNSLTHTFLFYVIGIGLGVLFVFAGLRLFSDYFYGEGKQEILPQLALLLISLCIGFISSKLILKKFRI